MFTNQNYKAEYRCQSGESHVYRIGRYEVTVDFKAADPAEAVRYSPPSGYAKESGPHVEINDGQVTIDLHDLLEMAIMRTPPEEMARGLWRHVEVREAFCEAFIGHAYGTGDSEWDALRNETLRKANENLLAVALNRAANALRAAEYYENKYWQLYHGREYMEGRAKRPDFLPGFREDGSDGGSGGLGFFVQEDPEYRIGSNNWVETRDWWRSKLVEMMSGPTEPSS